jgi:HYR domain-containing protein
MKATSTQFVCALSLAVILSVVGIAGQGPVMVGGRNVNINGGPSELSVTPPVFTGDFNKKMQNEGHCSSNPLFPAHMICAFNEYKSVLDLPGLDTLTPLTRDAWMGVAQSNDFGNHWVSDLLPGSLLDSRKQPDGTQWPLKVDGYRAAADAVTATTPGGLAHVSGIFFKGLNGKGAVAVSTFIDPGNDEANPVPFQLVRQSIIATGAPVPGTSRFIDKPWMEIGTTAQGTCSVQFRAADGATRQKTVPAYPIYIIWAAFTGFDPDDANTEQYFSRSLDCGASWSQAIKVSTSAVNQAIAMAVQPGTGHIYGVYRRFADINTTHAMMWIRSTNGGATFSTPQVLAEICPFTQGTSQLTFRINTFPTLAAASKGVYAAWSAKRRNSSGACDTAGPALIQISSFNATSGSWSPPTVVEDPAALGPTLPGSHQIFPSIASNSDHLGLIWYDLRNDMASINGSRAAASSASGIVEPVAQPGTTATRHTVDVRGVMADVSGGGLPSFGPSAEISRYLTGVRASDPTNVVQVQFNRPNMRLFRLAPTSDPRGVPFFSDYISLTPIRGATGSSGPLFYAAWTDTRDALSVNTPTTWTAPNWSIFGAQSLVDSTQTRPLCTANPYAGVLDMNLYGAVVSKGGLFAYSPNSSKPLGATARTFLVVVRNSETSGPTKRVRLSIRANPTGGSALFIPEQAAAVEADIPNISSITRTIEVKEDNNPHTVLAANASITVDITEIGGVGQTLSIVLNGDPNALPPINVSDESYTPVITDDLTVSSPEIDSPEIDSPEIDSPEIDSNALSPEIDSPEIDSPEIDSPEIDSPEIDSAAITDVTYKFTNTGNSATSFRTRYVGDLDPALYSIQLLIRDQYTTQASNCDPAAQFRTNQVAVNINLADVTSASVAADSVQNASAFLRPGATAIVTARIRARAGAPKPKLTKEDVNQTFGLVVKADGKTRPTAALDHVKPRFTKRADIVVPSTNKDGAIVTFDKPPVLDRVDAVLGIPVTSVCASATGLTSGSLFPIGTTTILCTATDSSGNTGTTDFTITVTKSKK